MPPCLSCTCRINKMSSPGRPAGSRAVKTPRQIAFHNIFEAYQSARIYGRRRFRHNNASGRDYRIVSRHFLYFLANSASSLRCASRSLAHCSAARAHGAGITRCTNIGDSCDDERRRIGIASKFPARRRPASSPIKPAQAGLRLRRADVGD